MRIEPYSDGWVVHHEPNEIKRAQLGPRGEERTFSHSGILGFINRRGTIRISYPVQTPRDWGRMARYALEDARSQLWKSGELRNRAEERARAEEAREGDFVARLDDGRQRRFYGWRSASSHSAPGAYDWIVDELNAGRASYGEVFRDIPPAIYTEPKVIPAREGYGPLIVGENAHFPLHTLMRSQHATPGDWRGRAHDQMPDDVRRAYAIKREAMHLVDVRHAEPSYASASGKATPAKIAAEWDVAGDAFEESNVPFQAAYARANAEYWWRRARVTSRQRASSSRRRRDQRTR